MPLVEGPCNCTVLPKEREQEAILDRSHLILTLLHRAVHTDHHVGSVMHAVAIVGDREGVSRLDGEVGVGDRGWLGRQRLGHIYYLLYVAWQLYIWPCGQTRPKILEVPAEILHLAIENASNTLGQSFQGRSLRCQRNQLITK